MSESAVPVGLLWAACMGGTTIGLMVLLRPRVIRSVRRRWLVFVLLATLATGFLAAAGLAVHSGPMLRDILPHTVATLSFIGFIWVYTVIALFVGLVVLPMKLERTPRRGGFITPRQGP